MVMAPQTGNANYTSAAPVARSSAIQAATVEMQCFYQPTNMGGVVSTTKVRITVPIKFRVFAGTIEITDSSRIKVLVTAVTCPGTNIAVNDIEQVATGLASLCYQGGQLIYNCKL